MDLASRVLFGLAPAEPGLNLTSRRGVAAAAAGHEVHHFRKRVEPRLVEQIAWVLLIDADRFTHAQLAAPRLAPAGERQRVAADPFAWEVTEQEEALARVWSAIYALRAELLAVERLVSLDIDDQQVIAHIVTAAWRWALASTIASTYAVAFPTAAIGPATDGGSAGEQRDHIAAELVALAGWTPTLTPAQQQRLRAAVRTSPAVRRPAQSSSPRCTTRSSSATPGSPRSSNARPSPQRGHAPHHTPWRLHEHHQHDKPGRSTGR